MPELPLTGERTLPGIPHENYWFRRHEAAYAHVATRLATGRTLDIGCGEGYGTASLASGTTSIVGLDYDIATIRHATTSYPNATFAVANLAALPIRNAAIDTVVALQVIEHVWGYGEFLAECRRVLRAGGLLVISTPNRLTFSPAHAGPVNPFHTKEFSAAELNKLIRDSGFTDATIWGVHVGRHLAELDSRHHGLVESQLATTPDAWPTELRSDVAAVRAEDFLVLPATDRDVDTALDLVLVARRP